MLDQLKAMLGLRFTLAKHTWTRSKWGPVSMILIVIVAALAVLGSAAATVGLFVVGALLLKGEDPFMVLLLADGIVFGFCVFWISGLLAELQRSDVVDLRKMLYLPVSLRAVFGLNFAASLFTPATLFFALSAVGFAAGLAVGFGMHMLLAIPLAGLFLLALGAWTYYLRGILAIIMENKRRRRAILMFLPMMFVLLFQLPNLAQFAFRDDPAKVQEEQSQSGPATHDDVDEEAQAKTDETSRKQQKRKFMTLAVLGNKVVPLGWLPLGTHALAERRYAVAGYSALGLALAAGAGLAVGYRSTRRYYLGRGRARKAPKAETAPDETPRKKKKDGTSRNRLAAHLPILDDDTAAGALAGFYTYLRHPQLRMQLIAPTVIGGIFLFYFSTRASELDSTIVSGLAAMGIVMWPMIMLGMFLFNLFGMDGPGFRALVLLPTPRYKYLLGRNLALFPFVGGLVMLFLVAGAILFRLPAIVVLTSLLQVLQIYLVFCILGNVCSIYFPFRMSMDAMRRAKPKPVAILVALVSMIAIILLLIPSALCMLANVLLQYFYGVNGAWVGLGCSVLLVSLAALAYRWSLPRTGKLLQRREQAILDTLAHERE